MKNWKHNLKYGGAFALASLPALLSAQEAKDEKGKERPDAAARGIGLSEVRKADKDGDGIVTKEEFTAMVHETMFARMDANTDGKIDDAEIKRLEELREMARERMMSRAEGRPEGTGPDSRRPEGPRPEGPRPDGPKPEARRPEGPPPAPEMSEDGVTPKAPRPENRERYRDSSMSAFEQNLEISQKIVKELDVNGDGKIGKDEAPERVLAAFEKLDTNKDGVLDTGDAGLEKNLKDREKGMRAEMGNIMEKMDKNSDGKIDKSEAPPMLLERFEKIDTNADGALDKDELKAGRPEGLGGKPGKESRKEKKEGDGEPAAAPATAPEEKPAA